MSEGIAIFWLPNGVVLAALLLVPRRYWPLHLLLAVVAEIAAYLLERVARPFRLDSLRHVAHFGAYVLVASGLAGLVGASIYALSGPTATSFWTYWKIWWLGDGLGVLLITPLVLGWLQRARPFTEPRRLEAAALLALTLLIAGWVFSPAADLLETVLPRRAFLLLPLAVWAAARFGMRGGASVPLLIAGIAITATLHGRGPLVLATPEATVLLLQEYLAVLILPTLALSALFQELRERNARLRSRETELRATHDALDRLNRELEARVESRTQELRLANQRLAELASIDPLTAISNRRHFLELAKPEISRAKRLGLPLAVIMLDIDFFKSVNDRFGHEAGDKVLVALAATVRGALRGGDIFARLGGEEFVLMLPGQGFPAAVQLAERLRELVAQNEVPGSRAHITVSAGVAGLENDSDEIDDLLRRADRGLYRAKSEGRDRVCVARTGPA